MNILAISKGCPFWAAALVIHGGVISEYLTATVIDVREPHRWCLADEPIGNLDSTTLQKIFELFGRLNQNDLTAMVVTHNRDLARHVQKICAH